MSMGGPQISMFLLLRLEKLLDRLGPAYSIGRKGSWLDCESTEDAREYPSGVEIGEDA